MSFLISDNFGHTAAVVRRVLRAIGMDGQAAQDKVSQSLHRYFTYEDWNAVRLAKMSRGRPMAWFLIQEPGQDGSKFREEYLCAYTLGEALAYLADRASSTGVVPDRMEVSSDARLVEFFSKDKWFANVLAIGVPTEDSGFRSRVESTLLGLRKSDSPEKELAKRISKWPGLAKRVKASANVTYVKPFPCPSEWLLSARLMLAELGVEEPPLAMAQAVVAAVFDFPSWHHLCGVMGDKKESADWVTLQGPFVLVGSKAYDGVGSFSAMARRFFSALAEEGPSSIEVDTIHEESRIGLTRGYRIAASTAFDSEGVASEWMYFYACPRQPMPPVLGSDLNDKLKAGVGVLEVLQAATAERSEHTVAIDLVYAKGATAKFYELEKRLESLLASSSVGECQGHEFTGRFSANGSIELEYGTLYFSGPDADALFSFVRPFIEAESFVVRGTARLAQGPSGGERSVAFVEGAMSQG